MFLLAVPSLAATSVIDHGGDLWQTRAGSSFVDFAKFPIPAGFFCARSAAFTGRIAVKGSPLVTSNPRELGETDTVVERLDDAVFDRTGQTSTRLQVKALRLVSVAPLRTACGEYNLRVSLNGHQPITRMAILREDKDGGHFLAPVRMNLKLVFTSAADKNGQSLVLTRNNFRLAGDPSATWTSETQKQAFARSGPVMIDTDGDSIPDTLVPGTSRNFLAGLKSGLNKTACCPEEVCHVSSTDGTHCTRPSNVSSCC